MTKKKKRRRCHLQTSPLLLTVRCSVAVWRLRPSRDPVMLNVMYLISWFVSCNASPVSPSLLSLTLALFCPVLQGGSHPSTHATRLILSQPPPFFANFHPRQSHSHCCSLPCFVLAVVPRSRSRGRRQRCGARERGLAAGSSPPSEAPSSRGGGAMPWPLPLQWG